MTAIIARTPSWRRLETWFVAAAIAIIAVTGGTAWADWRQFNSNRKITRAGRDALEQNIVIFAAVREAESDQRAFLWTGSEKDFATYRSAAVLIPQQLKKLRESAPDQIASIDELERLIDEKFRQLKETASLRASDGIEVAVAKLLSPEYRKTSDDLRKVSRKITAAKYATYSAGSARSTEMIDKLLNLSLFGDLVPCALLLLAAVSIHTGEKRRDSLVAALRENEQRSQLLRTQAEAAESRTRNILESIADGFISFDYLWTVTYCNAEAGRIFGRSQTEIVGKSFWTEFPDLVGSSIEAEYKAVAADRKPKHFEAFVPSRNKYWDQGAYPAADGLTVYLRDVTERKRFEERARHSHKLESLGVLAGGIAHDFNNLLTAILGSASLIVEDLPESSALRPLAENVVNASERASQLTRQMLAYSGRGRFEVENLDLAVQVQEITALLESAITAGVELKLDLKSDGALIEADAGQIQQLVMNLVINGAEAIGENSGRVVVSTRTTKLDASYFADTLDANGLKPGLFVVLEVHDTGSGMDEATLARIFDPFFTTKFTGRGLGMAAVLGIVKGHCGGIKVHSNPGQGTTFIVFFPVVAGPATPKAAQPVRDYTGTATIMVVDDEEVVQKLTQSTLERYGYKVVMASNGLEAISLFETMREQIALVLLDMTMPVMSGEETLINLKRLKPDVRVLASSGYNEVEALRRFGQGVHAFLQKPYRAAQLAEKIKATLT